MRRILAIAAALAATTAMVTPAGAESWKAYGSPSEKGLQWSYDADYSYRDQQTGKVIVMQAIGKVGAEPRMGPSGPGKPDGVGSVLAVDCKDQTLINLGGYTPKKPLELSANWRMANAAAAKSPEDKALIAAVCPTAASLTAK